ncbi:MGDG synthase family glycosyltransferase [Nocardioides panaciterrulae]|uniref:UDP-N-acetylglucosamine:LPS N-acetylglucosamine transferase n=1 Tax=Nocardioides panaciterrulae TaxID=661492 RepID=A0A7Y9JA99_9ACTN|nr:glycosyltransferase [Nocardioides panaciterrulae]NYD40911.1 UDP-N-acetylglucosamine:LPS N-acetylglucosamine transferase [Nocardioides panaciterrulae]
MPVPVASRRRSLRPVEVLVTATVVFAVGYAVDLSSSDLLQDTGAAGHDPVVARLLALVLALVVTVAGLAAGTSFRAAAPRRSLHAPSGLRVPLAQIDGHPAVAVHLPAGPLGVHVISGSFGAGHDSAAQEISWRLVEAGHRVQVWDVVDFFPARVGPLVRWLYLEQLDLSPRSWGLLLRHLQPGTLLHRCVVGAVSALPARRIRRLTGTGTDLVVSTHPFASQALGRLRRRGQLGAPALTYLTDASVHPLWVHPGIDLHLAHQEVAAAQARALGARVELVTALVPKGCDVPLTAAERAAVRARAGLPLDAPVVLVVGGSLGIGELTESARDIAATGLAVPVVVTGRNEALHERLRSVPGIVSLGWRDDLEELIKAADVVVQNSGGFTSLQTLAAGTPLISYRDLPGHGTTNAEALAAAGAATFVRDPADLAPALEAALARGRAGGSETPVHRALLEVLFPPARTPVGAA